MWEALAPRDADRAHPRLPARPLRPHRARRRAKRSCRRSVTSSITRRCVRALERRSREPDCACCAARASRRSRTTTTSARIEFETPTGGGECFASVVAIADGTADDGGRRRAASPTTGRARSSRGVETDAPPRGTRVRALHARRARSRCCRTATATRSSGRLAPERAERLCDAHPETFLARAAGALRRARRALHRGQRARSAAARRCASPSDTTFGRAALIGNAAQALHPGRRPGFQSRTARCVGARGRNRASAAPDDEALLAAYRARRRIDRAGGIAFTHALVKVFSNDSAAARARARRRAHAARQSAAREGFRRASHDLRRARLIACEPRRRCRRRT